MNKIIALGILCMFLLLSPLASSIALPERSYENKNNNGTEDIEKTDVPPGLKGSISIILNPSFIPGAYYYVVSFKLERPRCTGPYKDLDVKFYAVGAVLNYPHEICNFENEGWSFTWGWDLPLLEVSGNLDSARWGGPNYWAVTGMIYVNGKIIKTSYKFFKTPTADHNRPTNFKPTKPVKISGTASGKTGIEYQYNYYSTDKNDDYFWLLWDWDDGSDIEWSGPYQSYQTGSCTHKFSKPGTYNVKVQARDVLDDYSIWSETHTVTISKRSRQCSQNTILLNLLEKFPILFNLIKERV